MVSVTISIVRNGEELVPVNIIGMIICLGGITAHVIRKATQPTEQLKSKRRSRTRLPRNYAVLSQSSSESDVDDELFLDVSKQDQSVQKSSASTDQQTVASAQPLLWNESESEFSSDDDTFPLNNLRSEHVIGSKQKRAGDKTWNSVSDDFFLRDNRTWTSVKDAHVQMRYDDSLNKAELNGPGKHMKTSTEKNVEILIDTEKS